MKEGKSHESSSVCEADLREVQDYQAEGPCDGHLRESEAQAEAGLILQRAKPGLPKRSSGVLSFMHLLCPYTRMK